MAQRAYQQHDATPTTGCQPFLQIVADGVRQIRHSADRLSPRESQVLSDLARGRGTSLFEQALDIAKYRCMDPAAATSLVEGARGYVLHDHPGMCLPFLDTLRYEGSTNTMADEALTEWILNPTPATRARMIETHHAQALASRAVADLIHSGRSAIPLRLR